MAIINISKNNWYDINNLTINVLSNNEHDDLIKAYLGEKNYKDIVSYYSKKCKDFNIKDCLEYLLIESDLQSWSFDWTNCLFYFPMFTQYDWWNKKEIFSHTVDLDGWSQYEYQRNGQEDKQIFKNEDYLHILVANVRNGIGVQINLKNYKIKYYAIGEDDGHWFITNNFYEINNNNINYWKMLIMSEISELHLKNFDYQLVIEKIWNDDILNNFNKKYRW